MKRSLMVHEVGLKDSVDIGRRLGCRMRCLSASVFRRTGFVAAFNGALRHPIWPMCVDRLPLNQRDRLFMRNADSVQSKMFSYGILKQQILESQRQSNLKQVASQWLKTVHGVGCNLPACRQIETQAQKQNDNTGRITVSSRYMACRRRVDISNGSSADGGRGPFNGSLAK
jgi:hypothetical protein